MRFTSLQSHPFNWFMLYLISPILSKVTNDFLEILLLYYLSLTRDLILIVMFRNISLENGSSCHKCHSPTSQLQLTWHWRGDWWSVVFGLPEIASHYANPRMAKYGLVTLGVTTSLLGTIITTRSSHHASLKFNDALMYSFLSTY